MSLIYLLSLSFTELECEVTGEEAISFERNYKSYGKKNLVCVLGWWKVKRLATNLDSVKICNYGGISKVFADPDIPEAADIHFK